MPLPRPFLLLATLSTLLALWWALLSQAGGGSLAPEAGAGPEYAEPRPQPPRQAQPAEVRSGGALQSAVSAAYGGAMPGAAADATSTSTSPGTAVLASTRPADATAQPSAEAMQAPPPPASEARPQAHRRAPVLSAYPME